MRRTVSYHANPAKNFNPFFYDWYKPHLKQTFSWQMIHNKTLRTSGRGGKGHFIQGAPSGWNRKGRW